MCGESFTNAAKLVAHMRNIHGTIDKTYQCESCEYRGATHSALKAHMRAVHENIRKHRCDYCEFTSFASSALKRHILAIHEKRKPFECDKVIYLSNFSCRFLNRCQLNSNCYYVLDLKYLKEQVKKHSVSKTVLTFHYLNRFF